MSPYQTGAQRQYQPRQYHPRFSHQPSPSFPSFSQASSSLQKPPQQVDNGSDDEGLFAIPLNKRPSSEALTSTRTVDDSDQGLFAVRPSRVQEEEDEDDPDDGLFAKPLANHAENKPVESKRESQNPDSGLFSKPLAGRGTEQQAATADNDSDDGLFAVPLANRKDDAGDDSDDGLFAVPLAKSKDQPTSSSQISSDPAQNMKKSQPESPASEATPERTPNN
ncbi:hypothetical protein KEM55_002172, partial [Ascosphaera atra]